MSDVMKENEETENGSFKIGMQRGVNSKELKQQQIQFANTLLFETPGGIRYTQDSPILPSVWLAYANEPCSQQELILTVDDNCGTGVAAYELRKMLKVLRKKRPTIGSKDKITREPARVSYIPGQIAVKLYFDELMRVVLPLTHWWQETYLHLVKLSIEYKINEKVADWTLFPQPDHSGKRERNLVDALMFMRREIDSKAFTSNQHPTNKELDSQFDSYVCKIPPDLSWFVRISGVIGYCFTNNTALLFEEDAPSSKLKMDFDARMQDEVIETGDERESRQRRIRLDLDQAREVRESIVESFVTLYQDWSSSNKYPNKRLIWRVTKNRPVHLAVTKSALTVKADAARRLFDISCRNITWAIVDSGVDTNHPAFKLTTSNADRSNGSGGLGSLEGTDHEAQVSVEQLESRVIKTLDFTYLRRLLDFDIETDESTEKRTTWLINSIAERMRKDDSISIKHSVKAAKSLLKVLRRKIKDGKEISWEDLEPALIVNNPSPPSNDHGTHVAGILAADWIEDIRSERSLPLSSRTRRMKGVCPDINIIDVRVFREDGLTDEFELTAAIQFLRWMNTRAGTMQVHGANLSLSLIHEVRRFACGRTPICEECNEATALGMVIVAAAGNRGFDTNGQEELGLTDSYKSVSITDPGNADSVITVGSTHRKRPHEYGVSYFSSRGPTGDGRLKPDLVAPGEKIIGPTPGGRAEYKDGTSMAAPHVSGAAAMLMARHTELIGQPERIKSILCSTATDLGRERYFQGNGLIDSLRALQSV